MLSDTKIQCATAILCFVATCTCNEKPSYEVKKVSVTPQKVEYDSTVSQQQDTLARVTGQEESNNKKRKDKAPGKESGTEDLESKVQKETPLPEKKKELPTKTFRNKSIYCNRKKKYCTADVHPSPGTEKVKLYSYEPDPDPEDPEGGYYDGRIFILKVTSQEGKTLLRKNFGNFGVSDATFSSSLRLDRSTKPHTIKATIVTDYRGSALGEAGPYKTVFRCRYDRKWKCK